MKKGLFIIILFVTWLCRISAQNSYAIQETQEVKVENVSFPEDALSKSMSESLSKQGKSLGTINSDGSIYVIGSATTARPSNMPGFVNSRNVAYSIAEMTAKMNLLRLAGEIISSGRGFQLVEDIIEGDDPDSKAKATMLDKVAKLADKSLDNALLDMGVSRSEIQSMNEDRKKSVYEQNFNQMIRSFVSGMVKGCAVVRLAEGESGGDDYQVSVCVKYSPEFQSFASSIKNGETSHRQVPASKSSRNTIITMPESELVGRLGVWISYNENGEMVIYGFGQQEVRENGSRASAAFTRAYSQARLQAVNNIKNFVAEDLVANELMQSNEKLHEYADGSNAYFSRSKWEQAVASKSSTLNIATEQVRQWKGVHPTSKTNIAGCVVAWTYENAQKSNALKQMINGNSAIINSDTGVQKHQQTQRSEFLITGDDSDL